MAILLSTNVSSILNVTGNIANTGNLYATQNIYTGNISVAQNASLGNLSITQNATFGNVNVANLNVTQNISNTGNLKVTQNTFTGNLAITQNLTAGNAVVSAALNVYSTFNANGSPTTNTTTRIETGLSAFLTANTQRTSCATITAENNLAITLNETGVYTLEAFFIFNSSTASAANGAGGIKFDFGGGTATVNRATYGASGWVNSAQNTQAAVGGTSGAQTLTYTTIDPATTATDWIYITGLIKTNVAGTVIPRYCQAASSANAANLSANSWWLLTKVG